MNDYYELYTQCFPDFPTTSGNFQSLLRPDLSYIAERRENGRLLGYALVHGSSVPLLCVAEDCRGKGIGTALLKDCETHIHSHGGDTVTLGTGPHYILQGVPEGPAVQFFEKRGYTAGWTSINMALDLAGFHRDLLEIPAPPAGLSYRLAVKADLPRLLKAVKAAEDGWVDIFAHCTDPILLAELDGEIAGFEILTDGGGYFLLPGQQVGCVGCVGVVPDMRERGIGMAMVAEGVQWLKERGCTSIELRYTWLESWYGKLGFRTVSRQWMGEKVL